MSVELDPDFQLTFTRPFNQMVKEILRIRNPNAHPVVFKVKTTTPKQYCVRPNAGRIEPGDVVEVQVVLQPMREDPPEHFRCKDKFLVQSVAVTADRERISVNDLWQLVEANAKEEVQERRLRCAFLMPHDTVSSATAGDINGPSDEHRPPNSSDETVIKSLQRELREAKETIRQLRDRSERQQRELVEFQRTRRAAAAGRTSTATKGKADNMVLLPMQTVVGIAVAAFFAGYWFF